MTPQTRKSPSSWFWCLVSVKLLDQANKRQIKWIRAFSVLTQHWHAPPLTGEFQQGQQVVLTCDSQLTHHEGVSCARQENPAQLSSCTHQSLFIWRRCLVMRKPWIKHRIIMLLYRKTPATVPLPFTLIKAWYTNKNVFKKSLLVHGNYWYND